MEIKVAKKIRLFKKKKLLNILKDLCATESINNEIFLKKR